MDIKIINYWVDIPKWMITKIVRVILYILVGATAVAIIGFVLYVRSLPELSIWHTTKLKSEYSSSSKVDSLKEYIELEDRLFDELHREIYDKLDAKERTKINRYTKGSLSDPDRLPIQWNRTVEFPATDPKIGVLMIHGMSDSPYSLNAQANYLKERGAYVVNLRMPGHGTIPSGLVELRWQDMARVVEMGMRHLSEQIGDKPIYIMGYSTGASLALNYTLKSISDPKYTKPQGLILYSPAIGVTSAAALAIWQSRIGHLFGVDKLAWTNILPEYDPYKYGSFSVNAGDQVYRLTIEVQKEFDDITEDISKLNQIPPILSFLSVVDSTIKVPDVINRLYDRLPDNNSTLVLFDINRNYQSIQLISPKVEKSLKSLLSLKESHNYQIDIITNRVMENRPNLTQITIDKSGAFWQKRLDLEWSKSLYSLSHLAIPISPYDPVYGLYEDEKYDGIRLGSVFSHGENGVLAIPSSYLQRQRWNPFHSYTKDRVLDFLDL